MTSSNVSLVFTHDLLVVDTGQQQQEDNSQQRRKAFGQAAWLTAFWVPTQQRKHPDCQITIDQTIVSITSSKDNKTSSKDDDWEKLLQTALKKLHVEDLGDLAAPELWDNIPVEDSDGRGRNELQQLEKQLSVKVVFLEEDPHVLLVGAKAKLEKKCLVIRNVLSHYYWRLKGKQVNL